MIKPLEGKRIVLGVTGSIACYKAIDLASKLTQAGAKVDAVLTDAAERFIQPQTFNAVTGRKVFTDTSLWDADNHVLHIQLSRNANLIVIAPATANTIAKLAHGLADNLLTLVTLGSNCPLAVAPAMDGGMFNHPATQENLEIIRQRGTRILGPAIGHLASGLDGTGRMLEPIQLLGHIRQILSRGGPLRDKRVLVTAGGTREPIDPVRVLTNRSSGKQGYALALAALDYGAEVTLIAAPTSLTPPIGVTHLEVQTAHEMFDKVMKYLPETDILIMAGAVADFRPVTMSKNKIKKSSGTMKIELESTRDILRAVAEEKSARNLTIYTVGFAAETENIIQLAKEKLINKDMDMIVANDVLSTDAGFQVDSNRVTIILSNGEIENLPLMTKEEVAKQIVERILQDVEKN
jgi:phosphopantothenoylcysteine decarboxylase/phosphopantothenate--cysteine ligase